MHSDQIASGFSCITKTCVCSRATFSHQQAARETERETYNQEIWHTKETQGKRKRGRTRLKDDRPANGWMEREWVQKEIRRERWTLLENPAKTSCWNPHLKSKSAAIFIFRHHRFKIYLHINMTLRQNELWSVKLHLNQMVFCSHTTLHSLLCIQMWMWDQKQLKLNFIFYIQDHNANNQKSGYVEICWSKLNIWSRWLVGRGFDLIDHLGQAV